MKDIYLHNTLSGKKEHFKPITPGTVKIYSCGPTVYDFAHIGNFRSFMMSDLLSRVLKYFGYKVEKVQNITDVGHLVSDADEGEDKIMKKARLEKKDPYAIARFFEEAYVQDEQALRILPPRARPRATEFIFQQIKWCQELINKRYAYEKNGSVYFRVSKFPTYGALSKNKIEDLQAGARVETNPEKENPLDFALWKKADENHLMQWDSPWGRGFPGWHLECSVMSETILGLPFDIHTGGEDNVFPHHECEIAQNEAFFGGKTVNYWMHAKFLMVEGAKMSKSEGNFFTLRDILEKGYSGEAIRYLLCSAHYKTALNFTFEGLKMAQNSIDRLTEARRIFQAEADGAIEESYIEPFRDRYQEALADDLNVSEALATVFDLINQGLKAREEKTLTPSQAKAILQFLDQDFEVIFDIWPLTQELDQAQKQKIETLISQRDEFRANKDWGEADRIRDHLLDQGVELLDEDGKTTYRVTK